MAMSEYIPFLGISMKPAVSNPSEMERIEESSSVTAETLAVLRSQESAYRCRNYFELGARPERRYIGSRQDEYFAHPDQMIDTECREKMCEWCYRMCDCGAFPCSREMVAVAFSYLDRFMEHCLCDRASFKLAVITSFYIATKIQCPAQLSISSLVELSRGEFDSRDIIDMERDILKTLEWRVHPPTVQEFIRQLLILVQPTEHAAVTATDAMYQQATFFAELCVYDHIFISKEKYFVAVACLLNAMEVINDKDDDGKMSNMGMLRAGMIIGQDHKMLGRAQARLWYLYSCSPQGHFDSDIVPMAFSDKLSFWFHWQRENNGSCHSLVSVRLHG
jgi:hypothetical protein